MKKALVFIAVTLSIVLLSSSTAYAQAPLLDINDATRDYSKENKKLVEDGLKSVEEFYGTSSPTDIGIQSIPGANEYISLRMTHYYQDGRQSWSNDVMQTCGTTIAVEGCAVTSFAMVTDYYGYNDDPGQVNSKLGNNACPIAWSAAGSRYNLSLVGNVHESVSDSYAKNFILGALRNDRPVIVGFIKGSSTHFVVAYGYLEEEYNPSEGYYGGKHYYIKDPSYSRDYMFLDDYLDAGYTIYRLKVYDN